ncbi:tetratricopeptide repeat protein [Anaeromyxobacter paludicola]|uniref:Tetratricopeptide repeat protein n=1 Tax=Anaeromyxobacter paludicola TaxID=2918171 RepID=A0ABM7X5Z4_9BACT|nr:tetratricopeptide repeat protein [Anaeromyxobacter paludicola]BDG07237.1 hypothetical protein AMPC_03500 [Anaeromyxobacter paludicola]
MTEEENENGATSRAAALSVALEALAEGKRRFFERDVEGAHSAFERAWRRAANDPHVLSWYGVTLVMVERNSNLGVSYCDQAVRVAGPEPELYLNQARAHLALGQRERAVRALQRGLEQFPGETTLLAAKELMGWRRRPVLPFLPRSSFLNRWLGKLRYRWAKRSLPPIELSPVTLGQLPERAGEGR